LEFNEDGKRYKEKIIFDEVENTTEYDVPKHGDLEKASYLVDHKIVSQVKICSSKCFCLKLLNI